jgi:hypothetical protein
MTEEETRDSLTPSEHPSAQPRRSNIEERMTNRLKDIFDQPEKRVPDDDYYVVTHYCLGRFFVTRATADRILRDLDAPVMPRWVRFVDLHGSKVCLRTRLIQSVFESTVGQRASERKFERARDREEEDDKRPWEDD